MEDEMETGSLYVAVYTGAYREYVPTLLSPDSLLHSGTECHRPTST